MKALGFVFSPLMHVIGALTKKPKAPMPAQPVSRDDARDRAMQNTELLRRRGGAADMLSGGAAGAGDAPAGSKTSLGA